MRQVTFNAFRFHELSDAAKQVARAWMLDCLRQDPDWYEQVYEDADDVAKILGIEINGKPIHMRNGGTREIPSIWFTGFWSQGDGACFEGRYSYAPTIAAMREYAPEDKKLERIAFDLELIQSQHANGLKAKMTQRGSYLHSGCMDVEVWHEDDEREVSMDAEQTLRQLMRDFADWIYAQLQAESEHRETDEYVDEQLNAQEYEFTEDGRRCVPLD